MNTALFNRDARKAVSRAGLWILLALYKHHPRILLGYIHVHVAEMQDKLVELDPRKDKDRRRWLRSRISAWSWIERWVGDISKSGVKHSDLKKMAEAARAQIVATNKSTPLRSPVETFQGWKRSQKAA